MITSQPSFPKRLRPPFYSMNLPGPEFDGSPFWPSTDCMAYYVTRGFNCFRLPFKWARLQPTLGGALDTTYLANLNIIVDYLTARGKAVILDMHNYMRRGQNGQGTDIIGSGGEPATTALFASAWASIATQYKANRLVVFGLMNEPHDMTSQLNVDNQNAAIVAIRNAGASNLILAAGNHYTGAHSWEWSDNPTFMLQITDPWNNWAFDVHQYLDSDFSGTSTTCIAGTGSTKLDAFTDWARANGKRGYIGELHIGRNVLCENELEAMLDYFDANKDVLMGWAYWTGGGGFPTNAEFSLDPLSFTVPVDRPQMSVLQPHMTPIPQGVAPFPPYAVSIAPGDTQVVVTYTAGAGSTSHQYRINAGGYSALGASPATITGLTNSVQITVGVRAVNSFGNSAPVDTLTTPVGAPSWTATPGATIDVDFIANQQLGVANQDAAFTKSGGLGTTTAGLILTGSIAMTTALQNLMNTSSGFVLVEVQDFEAINSAYIIGKLIQGNGLNGANIEFRTMAATGSFQGVNFGAPGGHGSRQRVVYVWDTGAAVGEKAYVTMSGQTAVTGHSTEPLMTGITHVGSWDGTTGFAASAGFPSPKLLRMAIGETPVSRATAASLSTLT